MSDDFRGDDGARAGTVLDDDRFAPALGQWIRKNPHQDVSGAARRERHDEMNGLAWKVLSDRALDDP